MSTPPLEFRAVEGPSPSQRRAIEAEPGSMLVLAGPGAGKTYCLTERIHFLIAHHGFQPSRICAFTFTNKAAGEITHRLAMRLGPAADGITSGTIHAFCANLLRELGTKVGLEAGFGIADEDYQLAALRRIEGPRRWHRNTLTKFSAHRFRGDPLFHDDIALFDQYERFLAHRNVVDFDTLVVKAAELLERTDAAASVRARWDVVLVDEFQDLNPVQYAVVRALAQGHRHVFAVGDDEQSIYSWAGADPAVFRLFINDFGLSTKIHLEENRRCPHDVFALARTLININTPIFADRVAARADRLSTFPVLALGFDSDDDEAVWIVDDIRRDRDEHAHGWGDVALLYRTHAIGDRLEAAFLNAGIPCRLAQGRAFGDDPVVAYVLAAARVIATPGDDVCREAFFRVVLPGALLDEALAKSAESRTDLPVQLRRMTALLSRGDESARQIRRALADWKNLDAVGKQHRSLAPLVSDLLSRRVGAHRSVLDDRHDEISDPASLPDVVRLATRLREARTVRTEVWIQPMAGADVAIKGMLADIGVKASRGDGPPGAETVRIRIDDVPSVGLPLGVFKAAQLIEMWDTASAFTSFTAIDLETTDSDTKTAEIVEIAAVRVRDGKIVDEYHSLVRPDCAIAPGATATHKLRAVDLVGAPCFEEIWPAFREFCGADVVVAHNGYDFDFQILVRMARQIGAPFDLCTFDTLPLARDLFPTSRKLVDLARHFGIEPGRSHSALDDTRTLAHVLLELGKMKVSRARKTALLDLLGHLGVALALCDERELCAEARLFRDMTRPFALGRYSRCLDWYAREQGDDISIPGVEDVIERLGGAALMLKIRA
ncbi:MAG: UvrD-helicase domain-containing protein, partial [Gemmatimonadota bacterium]|nr:UvrD-helicase domain-containing protein [Gemmatimonadota bacterium]